MQQHPTFKAFNLWVIMIGIEAAYLIGIYFLLTVQNPFNFNNNYHLIGVITNLAVMINLVMFINLVEGGRSEEAASLGFFAIMLMAIVQTVLPYVIYFLMLDDFMMKKRQLLPALAAIGLFVYAFWGAFRQLVEKNRWMERLAIVLILGLLLLIMLEILTDIIPSPMSTGPGNVIYPL